MSSRWFIAVAILLLPAVAVGQGWEEGYDAEWDDEPPDEDWVWEDGYVKPDGSTVDGFYRQRTREGFAWQAPHYEGDQWVEGGWQWVGAPRTGYVLVPGHRGVDGYWVGETWRPNQFRGYDWIEGHQEGNAWVVGYWRPRQSQPGLIWEPGHWAPNGEWIDGHWRQASRAGFSWVSGQWRFGRWHPGFWRPVTTRAGFVWVPGYVGTGGWVDGQWREARRPGQHWVPGHWQGAVWVSGQWAAGPRVVRRHLVQPVRHMIETRRAHIRRVGVGRAIGAHGRAVEHRGRVMERRGERIESRGAATGNRRMELRGRIIQNRGEEVQHRGQRQQDRGRRVRRR